MTPDDAAPHEPAGRRPRTDAELEDGGEDCTALTAVDIAMELGKCPECAAAEDACACGFFKRNRTRTR